MVTNVFTPQIGGVTRSVQQFRDEFVATGHEVLVIAPQYQDMPTDERNVIRVPAIPKFYLDAYSLPLPIISDLLPDIRKFTPQIVHVHHPFLLGSIGQTIAADLNVPLVYTHHTRYSVYIESKTNLPRPIEEGILELIIGFCDLCDGIVAPSDGIRDMLRDCGVSGRISVIPTGVDTKRFMHPNPEGLRKRLSIAPERFVLGHVGRLAPEKNTPFLIDAVAEFLNEHQDAEFVVVGDGPDRNSMEEIFKEREVLDRVHFLGFLEGQELVDAYSSFDVFVFTSHSETQGMVLAEAMAAGVPVVAINASGVSDLLEDQVNGRLIGTNDLQAFKDGIQSIYAASPQERARLRQGALKSANEISQSKCAENMLKFYSELSRQPRVALKSDWERMRQRWDAKWQLWRVRAKAVATFARETFNQSDPSDSNMNSL